MKQRSSMVWMLGAAAAVALVATAANAQGYGRGPGGMRDRLREADANNDRQITYE